MLPGFAGHLLSESFLEDKLTRGAAMVDNAAWRRFADARRRSQSLGPASSLRAMLGLGATPLTSSMGFATPRDVQIDRTVLVATLDADGEPVVLIVARWSEPLELLWRAGVTHAVRRSSRWCAFFNGNSFRLMDAARAHSRRYAEFDLDTVADDERAFAAFSFVLARFPSALDTLVCESDRHGAGVCLSLKDGVLSASADVLTALVRPGRALRSVPADSFEQALTIVYRILFLLFAESRRLVPLWHPVYRDSYSIECLSSLAERSDAGGLWDALRAIARLAHAGCRAGDLHVTPFNGRLFAPNRTPLAERRDLDDEAARRALIGLSTRPSADGGGRERIAYRDLGVEQLGAVYETLLDYQPQIARDAVSLVAGSGVRKSTGTFYTPQPIADYLVRRTLSPLVEDAPPHRILELRVVDPAMGSGAFLVASCRYLAQAYESALIRHGGCHPGDIGEDERAAIRRTIAGRCLYGVDVNPMAVQLARLSLWLATLSADRPLTFLDHRLQTGDSLVGTWLDCLRRAPSPARRSTRRDDATYELFEQATLQGALSDALPVRFSLESIPGDTIAHVREKEAALLKLKQPDAALSRWRRIADVWCACWFTRGKAGVPPEAFLPLSDFILSGRSALPSRLAQRYLELAAGAAGAHRFFHWELEFPEVFFDASGRRRPLAGFDAVIGNPPWEALRGDAGSGDDRTRARSSARALTTFARASGCYALEGEGHVNLYQLFAERMLQLVRPGGRIGLVAPSGLIADSGSAPLRGVLLERCRVDSLLSFENSEALFPIHRGLRFVLMTASMGGSQSELPCRLGLRSASLLDRVPDEGPPPEAVLLPVSLIRRMSGADLAIPALETAADRDLAAQIVATVPALGDRDGWHVSFGRELNATDDRTYFGSAGAPVLEGKLVDPFVVREHEARRRIPPAAATRLLGDRWMRPRLGYREVAASSNRLTLIAAIVPAGAVTTHTIFCLKEHLDEEDQQFLCGVFNSYVANYLVRLRVGTHVTAAIMQRLPVPRPDRRGPAFRTIVDLTRRLLRAPRDAAAAASLQAGAARLYGLDARAFAHVLGRFPLVADREKAAARDAFGI
jgi:N-6 DNA Methylase/Eco57I restriction-modification methylase